MRALEAVDEGCEKEDNREQQTRARSCDIVSCGMFTAVLGVVIFSV